MRSVRDSVKLLLRPVDYHACYVAEVVRQAPDGSLDVKFEDSRMPEGGAAGLPITTGIPGVVFTVPVGSRCVVAFKNGKAFAPHVIGWIDTTPTTIQISANTSVKIIADIVTVIADLIKLGSDSAAIAAALAPAVAAVMATHNAWAATHIHTDPISATTGPPTVSPPAVGDMASDKVFLES